MATDATCASPPPASAVVAAGSLADLYERHIVEATRLAYLLTGSWVMAEDVAQDAFLRSASRLTSLRNPERFGAYLRRAVINEVAASHRARDRQAKREQRAHRSNEATRVDDFDHFDKLGSDLDFVHRLQALPERQRVALVLRFGLDLSEKQVAEAMRCAPGTVKSTVSRALTSLRAEMSAEDVGAARDAMREGNDDNDDE